MAVAEQQNHYEDFDYGLFMECHESLFLLSTHQLNAWLSCYEVKCSCYGAAWKKCRVLSRFGSKPQKYEKLFCHLKADN